MCQPVHSPCVSPTASLSKLTYFIWDTYKISFEEPTVATSISNKIYLRRRRRRRGLVDTQLLLLRKAVLLSLWSLCYMLETVVNRCVVCRYVRVCVNVLFFSIFVPLLSRFCSHLVPGYIQAPTSFQFVFLLLVEVLESKRSFFWVKIQTRIQTFTMSTLHDEKRW